MLSPMTLRRSTLIISSAFIAASLLVLKQEIPTNILPSRHLEIEKQRPPPPNARVMHTFIEPMENRMPSSFPLPPQTKAMINAWKAAWSARGWKTRVLTLADARRHPHFDNLMKDLEKIPLSSRPYYDKLCYIRYMAMAQVGGGWMSDFDTMPLTPPTSNWTTVGDRFTVYDGHVPSLVSGSASEYERILRAMVRSGTEKSQNKDIALWSDMFALQELKEPLGQNFKSTQRVMKGYDVMFGDDLPFSVCDDIKNAGALAVHFSHRSMDEGMLPTGVSKDEREIVMKRWLSLYKEKCHSQKAG